MKPITTIILCLMLTAALSTGCICKETEQDELFSAALFGDIESVEKLLAQGLDVNAVQDGQSLIEYAGYVNEAAMVHFLVSKGARPSIHAAAGCGDIKMLKKLISEGYSVNAKNMNGDTPLMYAIRNKHMDVAIYLLSNGANINTQNDVKATALYGASYSRADFVELLLSKGAEPNICDKWHSSPLHQACSGSNLNIVQSLIEHGAKINVQDKNGWTPLYEACRSYVQSNYHKRDLSIIEFLLKGGARPNIGLRDGFTPLELLVFNGFWEAADLLVKYGAKDNLFTASGLGHYKNVADFIARGADVKASKGYTALHLAAQGGHKEVVALLVSKGALVDARDNYGRTPLHRAASNGDCETVAFLLSKGAAVDARDKDGATPMLSAALNGNRSAADLLLSKGARVDARDKYGYTPLHNAAAVGSVTTVALLLARGADVNAGVPMTTTFPVRWIGGETKIVRTIITPLHCAAMNGQFLVSVLMVMHGADLNVYALDGIAQDVAYLHGFRLLSWYLENPTRFYIFSVILLITGFFIIFSGIKRMLKRWRRRHVQAELQPLTENP